ncbi:MAG: polyprenol monophosphomannose synthase [Candidatus Omnitrophota bacterium]
MNNSFSLIIPTYNEAKNIKDLCFLLIEILKKENIVFEIIIVDDNSPDGTWQIAENLSKQYQYIKVIRRIHKKGLATAVVTGWKKSSGGILGVIDGDLQHPPELLPSMLKKIITESDLDIVIASRNVKGGSTEKWSLTRRIISKMGTIISTLLLSDIIKDIKDPMSGYFILRRRIIEGKNLTPLGYKILLEVLAKCACDKIIEIPYCFNERTNKASKAGLKQYLISLFHIFKLSIQTK